MGPPPAIPFLVPTSLHLSLVTAPQVAFTLFPVFCSPRHSVALLPGPMAETHELDLLLPGLGTPQGTSHLWVPWETKDVSYQMKEPKSPCTAQREAHRTGLARGIRSPRPTSQHPGYRAIRPPHLWPCSRPALSCTLAGPLARQEQPTEWPLAHQPGAEDQA